MTTHATFKLDASLRLAARASDRYCRAYELSTPDRQPLTFVTVHLESPVNDKGDSDRERARADDCRAFVEKVEQDAGHARTAVYGDFNMNPFTPAMVNFHGLNAVSTAFRARRARRLRNKERAMFYNPMWSLLGDRRSRSDERMSSPGTFYMDEDGPAGYFWHMPDQVLVRSELSSHLDEVRIIDQVGSETLVSRDVRRPAISDHLPVLVEFSESVWTEVPR